MFLVQIVWNREFQFVDREIVDTLEEAIELAKRYMNRSGGGERVKKSRVINLQNGIIIDVS